MSGIDAMLAQLTPKLRDTGANLETAEETFSRHAGADLFVFPELFLGGYTTDGIEDLALDLDGPEVGEMARLAREHDAAAVFGLHERVLGGVANPALCLDRRGDLAGVYRKTHLCAAERRTFVAGDELLVVDLDGVRAGVMICFDVEFPEVARGRWV